MGGVPNTILNKSDDCEYFEPCDNCDGEDVAYTEPCSAEPEVTAVTSKVNDGGDDN